MPTRSNAPSQAAKRADDGSSESDALEEAEMKAKRERAAREAAKMSKASNKHLKKKKKKNNKKKKASKDEL